MNGGGESRLGETTTHNSSADVYNLQADNSGKLGQAASPTGLVAEEAKDDMKDW